MKNTYRDNNGKLRFNDSNKLVYKWIARKKIQNQNNLEKNENQVIKIVIAIILEIISFVWKVPSKEDAQIMIIQTIVPLSPATQPLEPLVTLLAIIIQIWPLFVIYELLSKLFKKRN